MLPVSAALLAISTVLAATMPLPPELKKDVVVVKTATVQILTGTPRPVALKGYVFRDFEAGAGTEGAGGWRVDHDRRSLSYDWVEVRGGFSFRLAPEGEGSADLGAVACVWGYAKWSAGLTTRKSGVGVDVPGATGLGCEIHPSGDEEPWEFVLWVDAPSNLVLPEFRSGGELARGEAKYEVLSTNKVGFLGGFPSTRMTGTLFRKQETPVAAVERMPGRIIMRSALDPGERSLFTCVGAAILTYDLFTLRLAN